MMNQQFMLIKRVRAITAYGGVRAITAYTMYTKDKKKKIGKSKIIYKLGNSRQRPEIHGDDSDKTQRFFFAL